VALLATYKAFHEPGRFVNNLHHLLFFGHPFSVGLPGL
jgi:hypothetical protein